MNKWTRVDTYATPLKEIFDALGRPRFQYFILVFWLPLIAIKGKLDQDKIIKD
jgi:hypothetical protein